MNLQPVKVLFYVWIVLSTLSSFLSLASVTDSFLAWSPFIEGLIDSYRRLRDLFWTPIFYLLGIDPPLYLKDYLTINSLLSVSIAWGFYNTGLELQFPLNSLRAFVENNLLNLRMGESSFDNFNRRAKIELEKALGIISIDAGNVITHTTRPHPKPWLIVAGILSSIFLVAAALVASYLVPIFLKWGDLRWSSKLIAMMEARRKEILSAAISDDERLLLLEQFDRRCLSTANQDREIVLLYHQTFRKGVWLYVLTVTTVFLVVLATDYWILQPAGVVPVVVLR